MNILKKQYETIYHLSYAPVDRWTHRLLYDGADRRYKYLKSHVGGYTSGMAEAFGCSKTDVNSKLYGELTSKGYVERLSQNNDTTAPLWKLVK